VLDREEAMILLEEEESLLIEGVYTDSALVGVGMRCGQPLLAVYDRAKLVQGFVDSGMTCEDAEEWVCRNVEGAWVGEKTPLVVEVIDVSR
tara:strand:- start:134 stop:406 length:273 start_codon:yes stop_codon:yes gene_type:complete